MPKETLVHKRIRLPVWLVLTIFLLTGYSLQSAAGSAYYALVFLNHATVASSPIILQEGTAGISTIYTNNTSAKVSVESPLFDYVDNNDADVDSSADKGMHSNFPAQQAGPDSSYDTLAEENTEAIEDYVDNNLSDVDSSSDIGTHSNFAGQEARDSAYDTLTEASQANTYSLDATGGYMIIGDGTPDWGSVAGTISFWVKMDASVQGRFYGQDGNMETRWAGTYLVLDWGGTGSMTSAYSFSADTWYFVAIAWDENNDNLFLYVGDENNAPTLDANSLSGTWTSTTPAPTENRFLNGLGGIGPVDGHGDDLRYWNIARNLTEIQGDYNETLSGSEPNLQSYFRLNNNFDDIGPNNDDGSGSGSYSFSSDVPFSGSTDYGLDLEVQWTNVIDFLPTEKLCIYTGALSSEDLRLDYWNGTGWENLATDLIAYSSNQYTVSLTSTTFTIRFRDGTTGGDTTQDQWQIDAALLRVEGAGSKEDVVNQQSNVDGSADVGTHSNFTALQYGPDAIYDNMTEVVGGGFVLTVEELSVDLSTAQTSNNGTLTEASDTTQAVPFATRYATTAGGTIDAHASILTDIFVSGTTVTVARGTTDSKAIRTTMYWVEFSSSINVYSGTFSIASGTTSGTANIGATVTLTKSFLVFYFQASGTTAEHTYNAIRGYFSNTSQLAFERTTSDTGSLSGHWWVVEDTGSNFDVDAVNVQLAGVASNTGSFSAVTMASTMVVASYEGGSADDIIHGGVSVYLSSTTQITAIRGGTNGTIDVTAYVIEFSGNTFVQRGDISYTGTDTSLSDPITEVTLDDAMAWIPTGWINTGHCTSGGTGSSDNLDVIIRVRLTSSTQITGDRSNNGANDAVLRWEVVEWEIYSGPDYQLDLEVQWTSVPNLLPYAELCIYGGTMGAENITVDAWNGTAWETVFNDLSSGWNNQTITNWLTSSTLTIRFKGGNETGDSSQDTWQIDVALIHLWYEGGETYQLDLEVQWTSADYTGTNEELCIRTGTFSGSENIQVKVWNSTGSSWHWVMNLTANQWNNVSITTYLTSNTLTAQFLGGSETGDNSQDSWNIDATLLHVWTEEWGTWSDELLVNPSFEMGNLTGWTAKGPAAANVEVFNATSGGDIFTNRSLRIGNYGVCTEDQPGTNDDSGVWQNVSLASYASAIDSGNAVINASAWLYPSEWDWDDVALIVRFYNSSGGFISAWNTTGEYGSGSAYYPQAWMLGQGEAHFTQGQLEKFGCYNYTIPVGTRTVGIQLGMGEHKDTFYCGGQADEASIKVRTRALTSYDYVLRVNNTVTDSWQIRLKKYSDSNINRLQNCTIYFRNSTNANSTQIVVENGSFTNETGPWRDLGSLETIYIAITVEANSTGTSYIYTYLEVRTPNTTTYAQHTITVEIT